METLPSLTGSDLVWRQPHLLEPYFELADDLGCRATLKFRNSFGSLALGKIEGKSWSFKRQGFIKTFVTVREYDSDRNIAVYHNDTWSEGGTLVLPDGKKYFSESNFWQEYFGFSDEQGEPLLNYSKISGFKLHARMIILPPAANLPELPWMILLGWYLIVMTSRDGEMVAALF